MIPSAKRYLNKALPAAFMTLTPSQHTHDDLIACITTMNTLFRRLNDEEQSLLFDSFTPSLDPKKTPLLVKHLALN